MVVHKNILVTTLAIGYIQFHKGFWVLAYGRTVFDLSV